MYEIVFATTNGNDVFSSDLWFLFFGDGSEAATMESISGSRDESQETGRVAAGIRPDMRLYN